MSIHPSLSSTIKGKHQRSVLKRGEKIKLLMKKGEWSEESKVYGLPKIKITRLKIKKEKAAEKVAAETPEATATTEVKPTPTAEEQKKSKESKEKAK